MITDLSEAIQYCLDVAEKNEYFEDFMDECEHSKPGCEDGVWKDTCRLPSNIPQGSSWGECSEKNCPLFYKRLECANEYKQLAEWLTKLKEYEESEKEIRELPQIVKEVLETLRNIHIYETLNIICDLDVDAVIEAMDKEKITMNNWTNDEKINKMIAEIIELRLRTFARSTGMYDGVCPHGLTYANDEMCVPFDECSECKKYLIEEQRKKIEKEVLEEYKIEYKENDE